MVALYSIDGKKIGEIALPKVFDGEIRIDLIKRDYETIRANRRQNYGAKELAGMRHSVEWWGKGRGVSRVQRITGMRRGAQSPGTVGGRRAFPPKPEKILVKKINKKERRLARYSALRCCKDRELLEKKGIFLPEKISLPIVIEKKFEDIDRTKDVIEVLEKIGIYENVMKAKNKTKVRAGKGKMRGRRYKVPRSLLIVAPKSALIERGARNLPGVDICTANGLNTEILSPGGIPGRLVIFTAGAIKEMEKW
ncbi:MAG: 50S ribosomal protein L4 [Candidatus Thermoplasmatota archaeon]